MNKPLDVDLDDSFDCSENDIVVYTKEDLTNYSKNLGLNVVKLRPLPEIGALGSKPTTPTGKKKKVGSKKKDSTRKLNQISGIYGSEPANSRINRSKAFGYPLPLKKQSSDSLDNKLGRKGGRFESLDALKDEKDSDFVFGNGIFGKNSKSFSPEGRNLRNKHGKLKLSDKEKEARKLRNKLRKRTKLLEKQAFEDRKKKFKGLDLNAQAIKDKARLAQKKARKRIADRAIDYTFFLDYESPYAEYLPARYREWQPKEPKKQENNFINPEPKLLDEKLDEISQLYKQDAPMSANTNIQNSRPQPPKKRNKSGSNTKLDGESAFSFAKHLHPSHRHQNSKFNKERKSISNDKNRVQPARRQPIILDEFDDSIQLDSDEDGLQVFNPKKKKKKNKEEKKNKINTSLIQSERAPHLIPTGMDIEENRYVLEFNIIVMGIL